MRLDWPRILDDIAHCLGDPHHVNPDVRSPASLVVVSVYLDVPRGTLRGWLAGAEPRHADGEALLVAWCRLTGKARTFAPAAGPVMSAARAK